MTVSSFLLTSAVALQRKTSAIQGLILPNKKELKLLELLAFLWRTAMRQGKLDGKVMSINCSNVFLLRAVAERVSERMRVVTISKIQ